jgi:hypothetical protein
MWGFQSGMSGSRSRVYCTKGCICAGMSSTSGFAGRSYPAGLRFTHGDWNQYESEFESTLPGISAGETNVSASSA